MRLRPAAYGTKAHVLMVQCMAQVGSRCDRYDMHECVHLAWRPHLCLYMRDDTKPDGVGVHTTGTDGAGAFLISRVDCVRVPCFRPPVDLCARICFSFALSCTRIAVRIMTFHPNHSSRLNGKALAEGWRYLLREPMLQAEENFLENFQQKI